MGKYFGTDGFRGEAGITLTADHAYKVGRFLGWYYNALRERNGNNEPARIVIGKDTRRSSYMFEYSLVAGLTASGADAYLLHVTTTPSVAYIARVDDFDCGIMISASHNPYYDNGIKLIDCYGEKMPEETLLLVEDYIDGKLHVFDKDWPELPFAHREHIGCTVDYVAGRNRYMGYLISLGIYSFKGVKVGLDCANGSSWNIAKSVFDALGADTYVINTLRTITDFVCDLLVKYQDSPNVDEWLQALVEKHPQLLDQLQNSQTISKHITELENKLETLTTQRGELEQEIEETRQRAVSIDQQAIEAKKREMLEKEEEYEALSSRIEASKKFLGVIDNIDELQKKHDDLSKAVEYLSVRKDHLNSETNNLGLQFQQLISRYHEKMVEIAFDGFMASKMLHAAAEWENEQANNRYAEFTDKVTSIPTFNKAPEELIEYLCRIIRIRRPNYSKNTIINIAICLTQGFLTVFSGEPGCGKTSICNIFGEALGLNKIADLVECSADSKDSVGRYVAVSVERGWTSKRDFVGYYNPLSKTFDKSNRRIYDALHQLDTEKRAGIFKLPYIVLLDEANLSPMEYYWSDFMNICDDLGSHSKVNLGEDYVFGIPETLHFVATINNDHTTETLSPRLIDRAWIITLPQLNLRDYSTLNNEVSIPVEEIEVVSWDCLRRAFIPTRDECIFSPEIQKCYDSVITKLREKKFAVSPRIDFAIKRYWAIASKYFEMDDTKTAATTIALDYAIAQRILPKIIGNGEEFEKWLKEFSSLCSSNGLNTSAAILKDIIERGNQQMKYYQFFC